MVQRIIQQENHSVSIVEIPNKKYNETIKVKQECEIHITDFADTMDIKPRLYDEFSFDKIKCEPEIEIIHELEDIQDIGRKSKLKVCEVYGNFQRLNSSEWQKRVVEKISKLDQKFPCEFCDKNFRNSNGLIRHIGRMHKNVKKLSIFICDLCGKSFDSKAKTLNHMKNHKTLISCEICNKSVIPVCMKTHLQEIHGQNPKYKCPLCFKICNSDRKFKQHSKTHIKRFECNICESQFSASYRYKQHMMVHQNKKCFSCTICNKSFIRRCSLNEHLRLHDKNAVKPFSCNKCKFSTFYKKQFKYHTKSHEKKELREAKLAKLKTCVRCSICSFLTVNSLALRNHMRYVHPVELYKCDFCGTTTKTKSIMNRHMVRFHLV